LFDELQALIESMRDTAAGRDELAELMHNADPYVRIVGATHLLGASPEARTVLKTSRARPLFFASVAAKYTEEESD
jgi:hypothetical protein